jgi:hypothetical protein
MSHDCLPADASASAVTDEHPGDGQPGASGYPPTARSNGSVHLVRAVKRRDGGRSRATNDAQVAGDNPAAWTGLVDLDDVAAGLTRRRLEWVGGGLRLLSSPGVMRRPGAGSRVSAPERRQRM